MLRVIAILKKIYLVRSGRVGCFVFYLACIEFINYYSIDNETILLQRVHVDYSRNCIAFFLDVD